MTDSKCFDVLDDGIFPTVTILFNPGGWPVRGGGVVEP